MTVVLLLSCLLSLSILRVAESFSVQPHTTIVLASDIKNIIELLPSDALIQIASPDTLEKTSTFVQSAAQNYAALAFNLQKQSEIILTSCQSIFRDLGSSSTFVFSNLNSKIDVERILTDISTNGIFQNDQLSEIRRTILEDVEKFYEVNVVAKALETVEFLSRSPLAKDTEAALKAADQIIRNEILGKNKEIFLSQITEIVDNAPTRSLQLLAAAKDSVGVSILTEFDKILDANPKLRLSASQFAVDAYNTELIPRVTETVDFLAKSPLAQNTKAVATAPTSQLAAETVTQIAQRTAPLTELLEGFALKQQERLANAAASWTMSTSQSVDGFFQAALPSDIGSPLAPLSVTLPELSVPPTVLENAVTELQEAGEKAVAAVEVLIPALGRGGVTLSVELGQAGLVLLSNSAAAAASAGSAVLQLAEGLLTVLPQRSAELLAQSLPTATDAAVSTVSIGIEAEQRLAAEALALAEEKANEVVAAVSQWRFFSDPSHWQNGYWERQIASAAALLEELQLDKRSGSDAIAAAEKAAEETLAAAAARFSAIAQRNERLVELENSLQGLLASIQRLSEASGGKSSSYSEGYLQLSQLATDFQLKANAALTLLANLQSELSSTFGKVSLDGSVAKGSWGEELKDLQTSLSHYVEDFIDKGRDL